MGVVELALVPLFTLAAGFLARAGRPRPLPGWAEVFPLAAVAWVIGVQGLAFRRQPDYLLAFLIEGRGRAGLLYGLWAGTAMLAAYCSQRLFFAAGARHGRIMAVVAGALALCAIPIWPRLFLTGSTLEAGQGILRPWGNQPAVRSLMILSLIASFVPVAGAVLLVAADGLRQSRQPGPV